jgi:hypothetical protein
MYYWGFALSVVSAAFLTAGILRRVRNRTSFKPMFEDVIFVAAALTLPYWQFAYAMAHSDTNRIWFLSLAWFASASLWALGTAVRAILPES